MRMSEVLSNKLQKKHSILIPFRSKCLISSLTGDIMLGFKMTPFLQILIDLFFSEPIAEMAENCLHGSFFVRTFSDSLNGLYFPSVFQVREFRCVQVWTAFCQLHFKPSRSFQLHQCFFLSLHFSSDSFYYLCLICSFSSSFSILIRETEEGFSIFPNPLNVYSGLPTPSTMKQTLQLLNSFTLQWKTVEDHHQQHFSIDAVHMMGCGWFRFNGTIHVLLVYKLVSVCHITASLHQQTVETIEPNTEAGRLSELLVRKGVSKEDHWLLLKS